MSQNGRLKRLFIHWSATVHHKASLLAAVYSYYSLYYRHLIIAYITNSSVYHPGTLVSSIRMIVALYKLSKEIDIQCVPGDVVECGVYNGGSAALTASICCKESTLHREIWLFDSFEGLPKPTDIDGEKARSCVWWCHGDLSKVKGIFQKLYIPESHVHIVKGWFQDTFPAIQIPKIALLHIDADWYESVRLCLDTFYDNVQPGGFIVIDDYGHWEGCKRAVDEFLIKRSLDVNLTKVDYTGRYFQKPFAGEPGRSVPIKVCSLDRKGDITAAAQCDTDPNAYKCSP
jgi:hypothetical protein